MPDVRRMPYSGTFLLPAASSYLASISQSEPRPKTVYHYTSFSSFTSIARSKQLWASGIRYLNDRSEYVHFKQLATAEAARRLKIETEPTVASFLNAYLRSSLAMQSLTDGFDGTDVFVLCFSERKSVLSQWRAYCPSGGVSIGFSVDKLRHQTASTPSQDDSASCGPSDIAFGPCLYSAIGKAQLLAALFDDVAQEISFAVTGGKAEWSALVGLSERERNDALVYYLQHSIEQIAPFMKHEGFDEEREWRLVIKGKGPTDFRPRSGVVTPYLVVGVPPIEEVCVGPTQDAGLMLTIASQVAAMSGAPSTGARRVSYCGIPYRTV
jgi:hypothetical protein